LLSNSLQGLRILVLEDEYLIAMDVEQLCRDHGAEAISISRALPEMGADDAIDFDVAIIDVMLGNVSTFPFAEILRERGIPFLFATGYVDSREHYSDFADVEVVGKPYDPENLVSAILRAVGNRRKG
jgi:DNA-binding response OmpR family regulator